MFQDKVWSSTEFHSLVTPVSRVIEPTQYYVEHVAPVQAHLIKNTNI